MKRKRPESASLPCSSTTCDIECCCAMKSTIRSLTSYRVKANPPSLPIVIFFCKVKNGRVMTTSKPFDFRLTWRFSILRHGVRHNSNLVIGKPRT
jgi:hypothetical protein